MGEPIVILALRRKHGNGGEIHAEGQLVIVEQRPAGDREIDLAGFAAKTERAGRAAALVSIKTAALRTDRSAVSRIPTDLAERGLRFRVRKPEHLSEAQALCFAGKEEVLGHQSIVFGT